jgi:hypothetical protein
VGGEKEHYFWLVRVSTDASKASVVMLTNENLTTSGNAASVAVTTADETLVAEELDGEGIDSLIALVDEKNRDEAAAKAKEEEKTALETYRRDPDAAKKRAAQLYPALAVSGSPLNVEFANRYRRYKAVKRRFFAEPDWPIRLAKECSDELAAKPLGRR